jgi:hypothetical protein
MVQVLPAVPSFGEKLATVLGQAGGNIGQYFVQRNQDQKDQEVLNSFDPNASSIDQIKHFGKLSPEKQKALTPLLQQVLKTQGSQQISQQKIQAKEQEKALVEQKEHEDVSQTVNSLMDELEKGHVGKYNQINKLFEYGREDRAYFDELSLGIERRLAAMVGKGALNKARFAYLMGKLPNSEETDATNRGRLKALAEEFKVLRKKVGESSKGFKNESKPSLEEIFK